MALLIFDLDGTLIDSKKDLVVAVNAARCQMGMAPLDDDTIASYVGNGAPMLIRRAMGPDATEEECARALEYFIAYYHDHRLDHTRLYPGVQEALDELRRQPNRLAVLTNKPVRISKAILEGLGLRDYFFQVYGGNSFEQKKPHPIGVETLMQEAEAGREQTVVIGDSSVDIQTARNAGVRSIGVTYGFQPESLEEVRPDFVIDDMRDVPRILNGASR